MAGRAAAVMLCPPCRTCFNRSPTVSEFLTIHDPTIRLHHRRRRRGRLRAGEPAVRALRHLGAAAGSRPGHAARPRARGRARYLRHVLLQRRLFLAGPEGALADGGQFAAGQLLAGPADGRRLLGDGHGGLPRHARRLFRMGGARRCRLGLERRAAVLQETGERFRLRRRGARQERPGADPPHAAAGLGAAVEGRVRLCAGAADHVSRRHEHGFPRRLRLGADEQLAGQARLGRDLLSRRRGARAQEPHHHQRRDRDRIRLRRQARAPASRRGSAARSRASAGARSSARSAASIRRRS